MKSTSKEKISYSLEPKSLIDKKNIILFFLVAATIKILVSIVFLPWIAEAIRHIYDIGHSPDFYDNIALNLSRGKGYRIFPNTTITMCREPGYIVFLAGVYHLFGEADIAPRIFNVIFTLISAFYIYKIGEEVHMSHSARMLAVILFILHPAFYFVESRLGVEGFFTMWLVITSYSMLVAQRKQTVFSFMLCGIFSAVTALTRTTVIPFLAGWAVYVIVSRRYNVSFRAKAKLISVYTIVFIILFSIWPIRNYLLSGKPVLTATVSGDSLFQGMYVNKHRSSGKPYFRILKEATREQYRIVHDAGLEPKYMNFFVLYGKVDEELKHSTLMKKAAFREYENNPSLFLHSVANNLISFWIRGGTITSTTLNAILNVPILIMTIFGIFLQVRRRQPILPILLPVILIYFVHLPILATARHHVPTIPFLMLFSGIFLSWLLTKVSKSNT